MVIAYQADTAERIDQLLVADRPVKAVEKIFSDRAGNEKGDLRSVVECVAELFLGIAFLTAPEQSYLPLRMRIVSASNPTFRVVEPRMSCSALRNMPSVTAMGVLSSWMKAAFSALSSTASTTC